MGVIVLGMTESDRIRIKWSLGVTDVAERGGYIEKRKNDCQLETWGGT